MPRLCILTPDPAYHENWQPMADQFRALFGTALCFRPWTDAGDLSAFDLVLPLLAWGYQRQADAWYVALDRWAGDDIAFANPISVLRWNTDKRYLAGLEAAGVAIVPTQFTAALSPDDLAKAQVALGAGPLVVKPAISGGADGTYRLGPTDPLPAAVQGQAMLIQPMMPAIIAEGEYSLFYFGGRLSHAILKTPAAGDFRVQEQFGGREQAVIAPPSACQLAEAALAAAPALPLYARVDMVRDMTGQFRLMELEVIEPALFLSFAPDQGQAFAKAVMAAVRA